MLSDSVAIFQVETTGKKPVQAQAKATTKPLPKLAAKPLASKPAKKLTKPAAKAKVVNDDEWEEF